MREGADNANVELGAMLAVVVLLAVIRIVGAISEGDDAELTPRGGEPVEVAELSPLAIHPNPADAPGSTAPLDSADRTEDAPEPVVEAEAKEDNPSEEQTEDDAPPPIAAPPRPTLAALPETERPDEALIVDQLLSDVSTTPPPPSAAPPALTSTPTATPAPAPERRVEPEIFESVEQMPTLIGGIGALQSAIQYPEMARRMGVSGRVFVQFVVNEQGRPSEVRVARGIGAGCDEAAVAAVRQARFRPGMQRGRPVKVRMILPVVFRAD